MTFLAYTLKKFHEWLLNWLNKMVQFKNNQGIFMSGSGGSGGGFSPSGSVDCASLRFTTQLATPQPAVVALLSVGAVLQVMLVQNGATYLLQVVFGGQPAGGLLGAMATRLRECILSGQNFEATVTAINAGQVTLRIEPV